jgi:flagellar biogenesis protein FliO
MIQKAMRPWRARQPDNVRPAAVASCHPSRLVLQFARLMVLVMPLFCILPAAVGQTNLVAVGTNSLSLQPQFTDLGASAIRIFGAMMLVIALFLGGVWLLKNWQRVALRRTGPPRLQVIESKSLGNRFSIFVVGYDQQRMLIGCSPAGITLLSQLPPETRPPDAAQPTPSFARSLQQMLDQKPVSPDPKGGMPGHG